MSSTEAIVDRSQDLENAKKLIDYLKVTNLPKELIDDRRLRVNPESRTQDELILAHWDEDSLSALKTVRFLKDFIRYKAAPDLETKNKSFLRTAEIFRQQGIKNYYFMLQLNNPLLKGIDPYQEDLEDKYKAMILAECRDNFWYFLREVCKLNANTFFRANRGNISFAWSYLSHITTYMIMPRQQGKYQCVNDKVRVIKESRGLTSYEETWKRIGELVVGDSVVDRYGKESKVIGVHPGGVKRLYKLTFSDGRTTNAGAEHLWTVYEEGAGNNGKGLWLDKTTSQLIEDLKSGVVNQVPLVTPENYIENTHQIDPYVMGLFYVGEYTGKDIQYDFLVEDLDFFVMDKLPGYLTLDISKEKRIIKRSNNQDLKISLKHGLPDIYLEGTLEARVSLLQAFLDRGECKSEGVFYKCSEELLRNQLVYLTRSLGGTALIEDGGITITLPEGMNYFRFKQEANPVYENVLRVEKIEYLKDGEVVCIEVDNEEQLYITDDFIITHNTVSVQIINFWLTYIFGRGYKSHLVTLKSDNRAQFINSIKQIRASIPKYLINMNYQDKDSGTYLTYRAFGEDNVNILTINVPQVGKDAAGDLGRGLTVGTTNFDEPSYINWIEDIINGCAPSALTEMENMRALGQPYGISYITTPNTTLHSSGDYMFKKLMSGTEWREKFFDSFGESHLKERLLRASPVNTTSPSLSMVYNYLQLGKDVNWVKETIDSLGLTLSKAKIDLLLMWVEDGEDRLFDDKTREALNNVKKDKVWSKEYRQSGLFVDFFFTQEELINMGRADYNDFFIVGVDTSSAINKDACTLIIRSLRTGMVVGVGRYPLAFLDDVTSVIVDMLAVFNNSLLIIERNYSHHMIDNLLTLLPSKGLDPFTKMFNQVYQDPVTNSKDFEAIQNTKFNNRTRNFYLKYKHHFGFNTTAKSRGVLYGLIQEAVGVTGYGVNYDKLSDELINLRTKGDRIDHDSKNHDDLVIAWLLTYWFIKLGANKPYYRVPTGIALTDTKNLIEVGSDENKGKVIDPSIINFLDNIRKRVNNLTEELLNTDDNILALRLEAEIQKLSKLLPPDSRKLLTIDTLLEEAKLERNRRLMRLRRSA